jgi:hypothetical protein
MRIGTKRTTLVLAGLALVLVGVLVWIPFLHRPAPRETRLPRAPIAPPQVLVAVAARVAATRLIDNVLIRRLGGGKGG